MDPHVMARAAAQLEGALAQAQRSGPPLVWAVGSPPSFTSRVLQALSVQLLTPVVNVSLLVAEALNLTPPSQRFAQLTALLERLMLSSPNVPVLLDHLEVLFEPSLAVAAGRQIELACGAGKGAIAVWPGELKDGTLTYATYGHPEYQVYRPGAVPVINIGPGQFPISFVGRSRP